MQSQRLKQQKLTDMEAVRPTTHGIDVAIMENPKMETSRDDLKGRPIHEFMDELAKRLGKHYGLNDIREAL